MCLRISQFYRWHTLTIAYAWIFIVTIFHVNREPNFFLFIIFFFVCFKHSGSQSQSTVNNSNVVLWRKKNENEFKVSGRVESSQIWCYWHFWHILVQVIHSFCGARIAHALLLIGSFTIRLYIIHEWFKCLFTVWMTFFFYWLRDQLLWDKILKRYLKSVSACDSSVCNQTSNRHWTNFK